MRIVLLFLSIFLSFSLYSQEGFLNRLLAPGQLIKGHQDLEAVDCLKCHDMGKGIVDSKCLDCHKEIAKSVKEKRGFHGLVDKSCIKCHADHKGRDHDLTFVDEKSFDHKDTGYDLNAKHDKMECLKCHVGKREKKHVRPDGIRFFGSTPVCIECHKKDDVHFFIGDLKKSDCIECHGLVSWKEDVKFTHSNYSKYKLLGKHLEINCKKCHATKDKVVQYTWEKGTAQKCVTCHADVHEFGTHKSKGWPNPKNCQTCHNETSWKNITDFKHGRDTRFLITGKHIKVECKKCHVREEETIPIRKYQWKQLEAKNCESCHENPHKKSFSKEFVNKKCTDCHTADDWKTLPIKTEINFKHDDTRFKVDGAHANLQCVECHTKGGQQIYKYENFKKKFCVDCHKSPHQDQFNDETKNRSCLDCHDTLKFSNFKRFDHGVSHFKLNGEHKKLKCDKCHAETEFLLPNIKEKKVMHQFVLPELTNDTCVKCHSDYHLGQFQDSCKRCHTENSWEKTTFDHNKHSNFKLTDKHADTDCLKCHKKSQKYVVLIKRVERPVILYKSPRESACYYCHVKDDTHKGNFGKACQDCHVSKGWKTYKDFHKNFTLSGSHYSLGCKECHVDERSLGGMSDNCFLCHKKDDVHYGSIPNCGSCHQQNFWEQTTFRHSMTSFPLRGSHRVTDCISCHSTGIYEGTSSQCISCHLKDALRVTTPNHSLAGFQDCRQCHNQFIFSN